LVRDLAFAFFRPEQFPPHSALIEQLLYNPRGGAREREECDRIGKLLRTWSRDGEKGKLFDGVSNVRIDGRVAHFELGQIPEHATEMRAATNFLVANYGSQKIIAMPRAVPKIAIFEDRTAPFALLLAFAVAAINGDSNPQDVRKGMVWFQNFADIEEMNFDTGAQDPLVGRPCH
jgi:hypothetical protein